MRIMVLGGDGMLGHKMFQLLGAHFGDVYCTIRGTTDDVDHKHIHLFQKGTTLANVDAMDPRGLRDLLRALRPGVVVNCVGILKGFSPLAEAPLPCIHVNALLPHLVCGILKPWGGRLIMFSSDCVFDAMGGGYTEQMCPNATSLYGKTKHLGEVTDEPNALTLRTSMIGREVKGFKMLLEWFLSNAGGTVHGFTKAIYSGVTTNFLARKVIEIIENHPELSGLYHLTAPPISKYDLLCQLRQHYNLDIAIIPDDRVVQDKIGDRSMCSDKLQQAIGYKLPSWDDLLSELATDPTPYEEWYRV